VVDKNNNRLNVRISFSYKKGLIPFTRSILQLHSPVACLYPVLIHRNRTETMMQKWLGLAIVLALLAGCGNKGPLYLPDDARAKQEQAK
jgi:hypothetical protein